jgi:CBS domain-containing protein
MKVQQVMTPRVECIDVEATLQEAADKMKAYNIGTLPVLRNGRLVGMVTDRDITVRGTAEALPPRLGHVIDVMTPEILYCRAEQDITEAAELMKDRQVRRLLVLDRSDRLVGIVSLGDLVLETHDEHLVEEMLEAVCQPVGHH